MRFVNYKLTYFIKLKNEHAACELDFNKISKVVSDLLDRYAVGLSLKPLTPEINSPFSVIVIPMFTDSYIVDIYIAPDFFKVIDFDAVDKLLTDIEEDII